MFTLTPGNASTARSGPRSRARGQRGEALIEVLASVVLTGIAVTAVMASLLTATKASVVHRDAANTEVAAGNYVEVLTSVPYVTCAAPSDYQNLPGVSLPSGVTLTVKQVQFWVDGTNPPVFGDRQTGCTTDSGLQQVTYAVSRNGVPEKDRTVLKRFNGIYDERFGAVPGDGVRCTITADADTSVDEANPTAANGTATTMDLAGGATGTRSHALLRFDLRPDITDCAEGDKLKSGYQVQAASLRFYTWRVQGTPDCATSCGQVLERVDAPWTEASTTWDTQPAVFTPGTTLFQHGKSASDFGPRYQTVTSPTLATDVAGFIAAPEFNRGWAIKSACAPDYAGRTCDPAARFQIRTRETAEASQRPVLSLVMAPTVTKLKQIRNVAFGTCASVKDDKGDAAQLIAVNCSGQRWQSWTYTGAQEFRGTSQGKCMETASATAPGSPVKTWECGDKSWQKWVIDGAAIKYKDDQTKCLEIKDGNRILGTILTIDTCDGSPEQRWAVEPLIPAPLPTASVRIRSVAGNNCADPDVNGTMSGIYAAAWVQGFPCMGQSRLNQMWTIMATGRIVNAANGDRCLDGTGGGAGDRVTVDNCHQGTNQQWAYEGGLIRNLYAGKCLKAGTNALDTQWYKLADCDKTAPTQQWVIEPAANPATAQLVHLRNAKFGDCAEPRPDAGSNDNKIWTVPCDPARDLQTFVKLNNGELRTSSRLNMCIDGNASIGSSSRLWSCDQMPSNNVAENQHQQFTVTGDGRIQNVEFPTRCPQGYGNVADTVVRTCTTGLVDQQWNVEAFDAAPSAVRQIRNVGTGSCLDQPGSNTSMWPCSGPSRSSQNVFLMSTGEIRKASDLSQCLDVNGGSASAGAVLSWWGCSGSSNQKWTQVVVDGAAGTFRLQSQASGARCIQGALDDANVTMQDCSTTNPNQVWVAETPVDQRVIRQIRNKYDGSCLDLPNGISNGAELKMYPCLGEERPHQAFLQLNNGQFRTMGDLGKCLNVNGGGAGKPLIIWGCEGGNSEPLPDSSAVAPGYQLKVKGTSPERCEYLDIAGNQPRAGNCGSADQAALDRQTWFIEAVGTTSTSVAWQYRNGTGTSAWCLDVDARTTSTFTDGARLQSFPCLGSTRPNQSFVAWSNGMIRSLTTPGLCLDSGESNNGGVALRGCNTGAWNQKWTATGDGQLQNIYDSSNPSRNKCLQGGTDATRIVTAACSSSGDQKLTGEPVGTVLRPGAEGRIRSVPSDSCLEPDRVPDASNIPDLWTNPCMGTTRVQQYYLRLNNGQIRTKNDTTRCLDSNHGRTDERVKAEDCHTPASSNPQQQWDIDAAGLRSRAVDTDGQRRCVQLVGDGAYVSQQPCNSSPAQTWEFEVTP